MKNRKTTLMVTSFAPYRDGIAAYAAQEIRSRRRRGEQIEVVSPLPSAAHHHIPLGGVVGAAKLVALARNYDRVVIQFAPELLLGGCRSAAQRTAVWSSVVALAQMVPLEFRIHEIEYQPLLDNPAERRLVRLLFRVADQVTVHTEPERDLLRPQLGNAATDRMLVIDHGRYFVPTVDCSAHEAKAELALSDDEFLFLSIGFIQRHKGFDRAAEAFALADLPQSRLHIVGSGRIDHPEIGTYVAELSELCGQSRSIELHNRFVSDDQFDLWLQAADAVVLPYREIWSSSVVERARLFDKPIIASDLEQLKHQLGDDGFACSDIAQMAVAMEKVWSASPHAAALGSADDADTEGAKDNGAQPQPQRRSSDRPFAVQQWEVDDSAPDQTLIQAQISNRARGGTTLVTGLGQQPSFPAAVPESSAGSRRPSTKIAALGPLDRAEPVSARPGVAPVKQAVHRLSSWQIDPLQQRVAELQQATLEAIVDLETQLQALKERAPDDE